MFGTEDSNPVVHRHSLISPRYVVHTQQGIVTSIAAVDQLFGCPHE
jgi:hypothetical protein